jgi:hypothetical protein
MMMFDDDDEDSVNVVIDFSTEVNLVRIIGNAFIPARLKVRAEVLPTKNATEIDFDITFAKIKFWFDTIVSRTIVFSRSNASALSMVTDDEGKPTVLNQLMIAPHEPTDEHLGALFQAKMAALSGGTMEFGAVRVSSEAPNGLVWTYVGDWQRDLPAMQQWFNTTPYWFNEPWWARDDASTIDMISQGSYDPEKPPTWAMTLDFIEAAIRPHHTEDSAETTAETTENIVIRGAFRPTVIDTTSPDE